MPTRKVIIPEGMENIYDTFHYAPAIQVGDTLYLSGQVGRDENLMSSLGSRHNSATPSRT